MDGNDNDGVDKRGEESCEKGRRNESSCRQKSVWRSSLVSH